MNLSIGKLRALQQVAGFKTFKKQVFCYEAD